MWLGCDPGGRSNLITTMLPPLMRGRLVASSRIVVLLSTLLAATLIATPALADDVDAMDGDVPRDLPRLILDNGRVEVPEADPEAYRFFLHGEHQIRYQA